MNENKYWKLTPQEYIRSLFNDTVNGVMTITYYPTNGESEYDLHYDVSWKSEDVEKVIEQYNLFTVILTKLGEMHNELIDEENRKSLLTKEELYVWETFIKPLIPFEEDEDVIKELYFRGEYDNLEDEENELLERHYEWQEKQYLERLPRKGESPRKIIETAMCYEKAVNDAIPKVFINYIGRWLAEAIILYNYRSK